jgi:hypothetical protein
MLGMPLIPQPLARTLLCRNWQGSIASPQLRAMGHEIYLQAHASGLKGCSLIKTDDVLT